MVKTLSNMLPLGTEAPDFELVDVTSDNRFKLSHNKGKNGTVIMFICNHCPYVKHLNNHLPKLALDYMKKSIQFIAINSNDVVNYPDDSPDKMIQTAKNNGYPFPYLFDETQEVAKAYNAACTPDFYIFDKKLHLVYRGQLDDSRPGNSSPINGQDVRVALDNLLEGLPISDEQKPSLGCNIKWKPNV
jgi:peroxiredoxin